jgi:hypothetical protein
MFWELVFTIALALAIGAAAFFALWLLWASADKFWQWWERRHEEGER